MSQQTAPGVSPTATQLVVRPSPLFQKMRRTRRAAGDPKSAQRAAQYTRMSTDRQEYSPVFQQEVMAKYAREHGLEIVRTYTDGGRSGLDLAGRPGLQALLQDVAGGRADYGTILVYDVSRWGRFQDCDESACYEFLCRRAGIKVEYCAEQFDNDGTPLTSVVKGLKRVMAGEYSRELGVKTLAGLRRVVRLGFRPGGPTPYGLRRMLIDSSGRPRRKLQRGEEKVTSTDRVILVPGPVRELKIIRWLFDQVAHHGRRPAHLADELERRGAKTGHGKMWRRTAVYTILGNEAYIGNIVYNRRTTRLKTVNIPNAKDQWERREGAFKAVIDPEVFRRVQGIRAQWGRTSDEDALAKLRALFIREGRLTAELIDGTPGMPGHALYKRRWGSLLRAYAQVGCHPSRCWDSLKGFGPRVRVLRAWREELAGRFRARGLHVRMEGRVFVLNGRLRLGALLASRRMRQGEQRWCAQEQYRPRPEWHLIAALVPDTLDAQEYWLVNNRATVIDLGARHHHPSQWTRSDSVAPLLERIATLAGGPATVDKDAQGCAPSRPTPPRRARKRHARPEKAS